MKSAREVIASKLPFADNIKNAWAQEIIDTLTAAGFRIVGPGLLRDIEYVVEIANRNEANPEGFRLAAALRALKEKQG